MRLAPRKGDIEVIRSSRSRSGRAALLAAACVSVAVGALAQDAPFPVRRVNPDYPEALAAKGIEGWTQVTFHRTAAGDVAEAFVSDSSGRPELDRAVLRAVSTWRYSPAAGERCGTTVSVSMSLDRAPRAPGKRFLRELEAVATLANDSQLGAAQLALEKLEARALSEIGRKFLMESELALRRSDTEQELIALRRALPIPFLPDSSAALVLSFREQLARSTLSAEAVARALRARFRALVDSRQYGEALRFAGALHAAQAMTPDLAQIEEQLSSLPSGSKRLVTPGRARRLAADPDAPSSWAAVLLRETFRVDPADGALDRVELCCPDAMTLGKPGELLRVPGRSAECHVRVFGAEGATFSVVEPPNPASAP